MVLKVYRKKIWFLKIFPNGHPKSIWASLSLPCIWAEALVPVGIRAFDWADLEPCLQPSKMSQKKSDPHHIRPPMEKKSKKASSTYALSCPMLVCFSFCSMNNSFRIWSMNNNRNSISNSSYILILSVNFEDLTVKLHVSIILFMLQNFKKMKDQ